MDKNFLIYKIASKMNDFSKWEESLDEQTKLERDLIKRVQDYDDKAAMKQLVKMFRGLIYNAVTSSNLAMTMNRDLAYQEGVNLFKKTIKNNFNLNMKNKPSTYITRNLNDLLNKKRNDQMNYTARYSLDLTTKAGYVSTADSFLEKQLGRAPTDNEVVDFVNKDMNKGSMDLGNLKKIRSYKRRDLSGDQQLGDGSAGVMTLFDTFDSGKTTEEIYEEKIVEQKIEKELPNFTRQERKFIRHYFGLGEFKNRQARTRNEAAIVNNLTNYEAGKILDKLSQKIGGKP